MQLTRIWHAPPYAIDALDLAPTGAQADVVIAFSSIGHDPSRAPSPEFVATASGRGTATPRRALFISDASRSWANHPGFAPCLQAGLGWAEARGPRARLATLGLSMGAFSALVAMQHLPVDVALAFGPQWSVCPGAVPGEARWAEWAGRIASFRWPEAPLPAPGQGWAYLFHGIADDLPHALRFPRQSGSDQLLFPDLGHSALVPHLKARGALAGLLQAALAGDRRRLMRIAASAGGQRREKLFPKS